MNNWKVIPTIVFATALIYGAGVFTGGILVNLAKQSHPKVAKRPATQTNSVPATNTATQLTHPVRSPEIFSLDFLQQLDSRLQLTKDQHDAVLKIINDNQNLMRKVVQDGRLEIREVLTPEQRLQFDKLMKHPFHKPLFSTNAPPITTVSAPTNAP